MHSSVKLEEFFLFFGLMTKVLRVNELMIFHWLMDVVWRDVLFGEVKSRLNEGFEEAH